MEFHPSDPFDPSGRRLRLKQEAEDALRNALQQPIQFDQEIIKSAAAAMRDMGLRVQRKEVEAGDAEQVCLGLLRQAIQAGAFSGPAWMLWRARLSQSISIEKASKLISAHAPLGWFAHYVGPGFTVEWHLFALADQIDKFAAPTERATPPIAPAVTSLRSQAENQSSERMDEYMLAEGQRIQNDSDAQKRRDESRIDRWKNMIVSTPIENRKDAMAAAKGLRILATDFESKRDRPIELEQQCMELLCNAIRAGAFSGSGWMLWRTKLAARPHIISAAMLLMHPGTPINRQIDLEPPQGKAARAAKIIAEVIESFEELTNATSSPPPSAAPNETMPDHQAEILVALLELAAFDAASRKSTSEIAKRALPPKTDATCLKRPLTALVKLGLVLTKDGRNGGAWLTESGKTKATALSK